MSKELDDFFISYEELEPYVNRRPTRLVRRNKTPSVVLVKREFLPRLRDWWETRRLYYLLGLDK